MGEDGSVDNPDWRRKPDGTDSQLAAALGGAATVGGVNGHC